MRTKVKSVQQNGTWNSKKDNTLYYNHEYQFEDGTVMGASHKTQTPFNVGDEVEYEIKRENEYGKSGTVKKPNDFKKGGTDLKGIKVGHAISNAVLIANGMGFNLFDEKDNEKLRKSIKHYAKMIYEISEELNNEL